ncbi:Stk1 family PASTA domain-containing Ser/Thr kinase [Kibdelosporangium persicum]|uniref:non-specific serine/threonine protein kinase n=1 Tax=Kibdelosporangium persicum TaxID=2698649 RepID=A0ABX2FA10_9PSEU|nr:Stk1 family PASTA domain-containing Ser/Thr kinase [Kibdelosporangium persicum]NRN68157.1 Serine/threonine protein kinase PknL [Kibdelosporangium persicum]
MATLLEQRYRVDAPLARGGMSAVYRGMDTRLERPVAIKVMDHRFAEDRSFVDRFEREARAAASLHHPNVIAVHDQGFDGDHVFLVMELVDGGTLRDLLTERGRLTVPLALSVLEPVLSALAAAHQNGLVHRDVKPENVLIGKNGVVKVGDFGLVKAMASGNNTSNSVILGTVAYLSPEQVTTGATTARGDVYSAGVLLYEMLTGTPPYVGDTPLSVAYRHVNDDVPPPSLSAPGIPKALDELVLRATRRDPMARPADAGAFLHEVERVRHAIGAPLVPIPASAHGMKTMPSVPADATVQTVPVQAPPAVASVSGPRGTRAMLRTDLDREPPSTGPQPVASPSSPRKRFPVPKWGIAAAVLAVVAIVATFLLTSGPDPVAIPNVAGKDKATAVAEIEQAQLVPTVLESRSDKVDRNKVIRTDPPTGTLLPGSAVNVYVSAGPPIVPEVEPGATVQAVEEALKKQDLKARLAADEDRYDNNVPQGAVLTVSPSPGTQLKLGDSVTLILSKGPAPLKPLPDVRGKTEAEARQLVEEAGYTATVRAQFDERVDGGRVISTSPEAGAVAEDKKVTLLVSNAVTVPDLRNKRLNEARDQLDKLGLKLEVAFGNDRGNRRIFAQGPNAGARVQKGSTVRVGVDFFG